MKRHVIHPIGPFSLAPAAAHLAGAAPADTSVTFDRAAPTIRAAFPLDGDGRTVGVRITQPPVGGRGPAPVEVAAVGAPSGAQVGASVARALALDVDGSPLAALARRDEVVGRLLAERPGFRPAGSWSPYQAAAWAVLAHRTSAAHARSVAGWLAAELGEAVEVDGVELAAFPAPAALADVEVVPGIPEVKVGRLAGLARTAVDGSLDGAALRALDADEARARVLGLDGIGPVTADVVLVRGAQHPDVFCRHDVRLHHAMRVAYGRPDADVAELEALAEGWRPLRSWVGSLLRAWLGDR